MISLTDTSILNETNKLEEKKWWKKFKTSWEQAESNEFDRILVTLSDSARKEMCQMYEQKWANPRRILQGIMLGHALEIKTHYSSSHYTLIHGQRLGFWVLTQLTKEFAKNNSSSRNLSLYHFMRVEKDEKVIDPNYCIEHAEEIDDHEDEWRDHLISCDGYFFNRTRGESVDYFVRKNGNVCKNLDILAQKVLSNYCKIVTSEMVTAVTNIMTELDTEETIGVIYALCIPKLKFDALAFMSHPEGEPCLCSKDPDYKFTVLNEYQCDKIHWKLNCEDSYFYPISQYRICTDMLNPEDHRIFCLLPIDKKTKQEYKIKIRGIAKMIIENLI